MKFSAFNLGLRLAVLGLIGVIAVLPAQAQSSAAIESLGVPGPIVFDGGSFALAWSSHPLPNYYKQEYLERGQTLEHYKSMFMVDAVTEDASVEATVATQIALLDKLKASDPVVNYAVVRNPKSGEIIVDFVLSDLNSDPAIIEWNAYRYTKFGAGGIAIYAISVREYDDKITEFLTGLKAWRPKTIQALARLKIKARR
jgi:hypothetical protein